LKNQVSIKNTLGALFPSILFSITFYLITPLIKHISSYKGQLFDSCLIVCRLNLSIFCVFFASFFQLVLHKCCISKEGFGRKVDGGEVAIGNLTPFSSQNHRMVGFGRDCWGFSFKIVLKLPHN